MEKNVIIYIILDDQDNDKIKENIKDLLLCCAKVRSYMTFYKMQIKAHNNTTHHILKNEVDLILPKFPRWQMSKRGIFSTTISVFVGLLFKGFQAFYIIEDTKPYIKQLMQCQFKQTYKETNLCI